MTLPVWLKSLRRILSGRAALDDSDARHQIRPVDLPPIDMPKPIPSHDPDEKKRLEQRKREQEIELARLRARARALGGKHDT